MPEGTRPSVRRPPRAVDAWLESTDPLLWWDRAEPALWWDSSDATDIEEPIDAAEANEKMLPTEAKDAALPIERTESWEQIESTEFSDHSDHMRASVAAPLIASGRRTRRPERQSPEHRAPRDAAGRRWTSWS